jgi:hypothetical protein
MNSVALNGRENIGKSRYEGRRASTLLGNACRFEVKVQPLIVVMASQFTVKEQSMGVTVVGRRKLVSWLTGRSVQLNYEQVRAIFEIARRSETWVHGK